MYNTYYNVADIIIEVISPFPFYVHNAVEFECKAAEPDYVFRFEQKDSIPELMENSIQVADLMWAHEYRKTDGSYLRAFLWEEFYVAVSVVGDREGVCYYASSEILAKKAREGFELFMYLCIEEILLKFDCLVLHSSHIEVQGKGLIFSAPSQTGKSTQAELWKRFAGARILNGDRSVLRRLAGRWHVCGCPMCGTSNIHAQGKEKLSNIVMLSQAAENTVKKIQGMEAFRLLYPQTTVPGWDTAYAGRAMDLLSKVIEEIPIWHYACTKEPEAVKTLKEAIEL